MNNKIFKLIFASLIICSFLTPQSSGARTLKDIEAKLRKGKKENDEDKGMKGNCLIKVVKKTAAFAGWGTSKFYYVIYHCDSEKPLVVRFTARNKREDEFNPPEVSWGGSTTGGEQWDWEQMKGFLPKYFSKTKQGRRIAKFEQNNPLVKKYGQINAYKVELIDGNAVVDTILWNWGDDVKYKRGMNDEKDKE